MFQIVGLWVTTLCSLVGDYLHFGRNVMALCQARSWPIQDGAGYIGEMGKTA